jgi:N-acetylmuramoyl-L-alanine amidase
LLSGQELIALDDVATLFQVAVREDTLTGGITITYRGRTIVASPDQPMASVNGRVVTLPSPIVRSGRRWMVPVEFLPRALGPIYDQRIDLRRQSRLLIVGDLRVPRITGAHRRDRSSHASDGRNRTACSGVDRRGERPRAAAHRRGRTRRGSTRCASGLIEQIRAGDSAEHDCRAAGARGGRRLAPRSTPRTPQSRAWESKSLSGRHRLRTPRRRHRVRRLLPVKAPLRSSRGLACRRSPSIRDTAVTSRGRGSAGTEEKQLTLDVARRLRGLVETRLGLHVVLTRDDDRTVPLDQRTATANNNKADLFVSLHANAALSPRASGAEVYHLRLGREEEQVRREAEAGSLTLPVLGGGNRTIDLVRWDLAQARHVEGSATFASMLGDALKDRVPMGPRPHQQAPLRVLEGADMPAALVEMAYLTNPDQEKLAGSDDFKNSIAQAIYDAIVRFRGGGGGGAEQAP